MAESLRARATLAAQKYTNRVPGKYLREEKALSLMDAVPKSSLMPGAAHGIDANRKKNRTRKALIAAASELMGAGHHPTIAGAAPKEL
jgi:hypothetical protein